MFFTNPLLRTLLRTLQSNAFFQNPLLRTLLRTPSQNRLLRTFFEPPWLLRTLGPFSPPGFALPGFPEPGALAGALPGALPQTLPGALPGVRVIVVSRTRRINVDLNMT